MEILDLLTLIFCVLAVVLNAAACFVLLKRKTGKGARAYPFVFATFSFIFLIMGCIAYLLSEDAIVMLATLVLSGLSMLIYCATEKPPARPEGEEPEYYSPADLSFLMKGAAEPDAQAPEADDDFGIDIDSMIANSFSSLDNDSAGNDYGIDLDSLLTDTSSLEDDFASDDLGIDFDSFLAQSSSLNDDLASDDLGIDFDDLPKASSLEDDLASDDLGIDFDTFLAQSSSPNDASASDGLDFSADDLDDFDIDFDLEEDDFDVIFPPEEEFDSEFLQEAENDALSGDPLLDEVLKADFPANEGNEPLPDEPLEPALPPPAAELSLESAGGFTAEEEEGILKAGQAIVAYVAESMRDEFSLDSLLDFANRSLIEHTGADGGIIFLVDDYEDVLNAKAFSGNFPPPYKLPDDIPHEQELVQSSLRHARLPFEGNIFGEAILSGDASCIEDGESDARIYQNGSEEFLMVGSYIVAPLSVKDEVVGVAGLARPPQKEPFSQKDFKAAKVIAGYTAATIGNVYSFQELMERTELETGVELASKIQKTFLPKKLPDLPSAGFGFFFEGAKGTCTDYYDVIFARRDRIALVMADVAGKGIVSGMIMTGLRSLLHLVTNTTKSASTILEWVNKSITDKNIDIDHYAAIAYVLYSPETNKLEYTSAGGRPMLLWRSAEKRIETVNIESEPLGVDRNTEYKEKKLTVETGDIIILYSDGLVETLNEQGEQYGVDGLSRVIAENDGASAKDISAAVRHDLQSFIGTRVLHDDQTLLVMKIENP